MAERVQLLQMKPRKRRKRETSIKRRQLNLKYPLERTRLQVQRQAIIYSTILSLLWGRWMGIQIGNQERDKVEQTMRSRTKISPHWRIKLARAFSKTRTPVKMKACLTIRSGVTIQCMWERFFLIDTWLSKSSDGVTSRLYGSQRISKITTTSRWRFKRAHNTTWKPPMMRWKFLIKWPPTGRPKSGRGQLKTSTRTTPNLKRALKDTEWAETPLIAFSYWIPLSITDLMANTLWWYLKFWVWTSLKS